MSLYDSRALAKLYGTQHILEPMEGYPPLMNSKSGKKQASSSRVILDKATYYLFEKLSIDFVVKELLFFLVAVSTYLYMHYSGRLTPSGLFGHFIDFFLALAMGLNLFRASLKSLTPGIICLVACLVLLSGNVHKHYFSFLPTDYINYILGFGAMLISISLMASDNR